AAHRAAVRLDPGHVHAWQNLGNAATVQGDVAAALDAYERARALGATDASVLDNIVHLRQQLCAWDGLADLQAARRTDALDSARAIGKDSPMGDALGYRAKFAVLAPSTNTIVQPEFDAMRPRGVTNHFGRIHIPNTAIKNDA